MHHTHQELLCPCTKSILLDKCIALWWAIEWWRQWHAMYETIVGIGMMTNTMILCCNIALHKEIWVSISRLQQPLWCSTPSNKFAIFLVACAGVCGFRSMIGSHFCHESTAHFHVCRLWTGRLWPPADHIYWRNVSVTGKERAARWALQLVSFMYVERVRSPPLQGSQWHGAASNKLAVFLVTLHSCHPLTSTANVISVTP